MKHIALAVALILLIFAVPIQAQNVTDTQKAEIEKAIKNQVTQLYAAWDSLNAEAANQFWSRDKTMGLLTATGLQSNLETILKNDIKNYANLTARKNEVLDIKVHVLSPEMALAFSKSLLRVEYKNGNISNFNYANTTIWVKESGSWKLTHLAGNSAARQ